MQGRALHLVAGLFLLATGGCGDDAPADVPPDVSQPAATRSRGIPVPPPTGTIEGHVRWHGSAPTVASLLVLPDTENPAPDGKRLHFTPNPFRPLIAADSNGIRDVVVYLRAVSFEPVGTWPHGMARLEMRDRTLSVVQGGQHSRVGFVRRGEVVEAVNFDREYHSLRARGAAFFALPFVESGLVSHKRLDMPGVVDIASGAGYFWMAAHLLVVEHPYYARTDAAGHFRLEHVPPGRYEVVCWMPSWVIRQKYRDPESGLVSRLVFAPPVEQSNSVAVRTAVATSCDFTWSERQMPR